MGTTLSGLASGFDWSSLVDKLIAVARAPQNSLATEKTTLATKSNSLASLKTLMTNLQSSLATLNSSSLFTQRSATLASSSSSWSASASSGTPQGSYAFSVTQLATTARITGASDVGQGIIIAPATENDTVISALNLAQSVTAGEFTINGVKIAVATTDTLGDVFNRISTATGVTAAYDSGTDKITLTGPGTVTLGAANDTSNFLQALKLSNNGTSSVSSATSLGIVKLGGSIAQSGLGTAITAVDGSGAGTFTINGTAIAFNVNSDSIQNVLTRINASAAGVTASYDAAQDRFLLTNKVTGDLGITMNEGAGGFLAALGLNAGGATTVSGQDARFTIDGGSTITSNSNTFDATSHGIAGLSVTARSVGSETVSVGVDATAARAAIEDFVKKYNAVQSSIDVSTAISTSGTKVTSGTLADDHEINAISRSLRSLVFSAPSGATGTIQRLGNLGIDFTGTNSALSITDSTALDTMLANSPSEVAAFFTDPATGLGKRLGDLLENELGSSGTFTVQTDQISQQTKSLDKQIADIERRLTAQRATLEASFVQMENVQSLLQSQSTYLTKTYFSSSSSS